MAKINFNSAALYVNGKKLPGVLDVQIEKNKLRPVSYYGQKIPKKNYFATRIVPSELSFANDFNKYNPTIKTESHETGWKLIIFVSYSFMKDCFSFELRYGSNNVCLESTSEYLAMAHDLEKLLKNEINWIAEKLQVPESTEVIVNIHAESDIPEKIKKWSQQFDTVSYNTKKIFSGIENYSLPDEYYEKQKQLYAQSWLVDDFETYDLKVPKPDPGFSSLANLLPGINEIVKCPCECERFENGLGKIKEIIIHLNDSHKWTREAIADFLDTLDVDLNFKTPKEKEKV